MTPYSRPPLWALAITLGVIIGGAVRAKAQNAQNNQWCAYFSNGPTNCGFVAFEQCLEAIRGKTGLCDRNSQYVPPTSDQPSGKHRRRHPHRDERP